MKFNRIMLVSILLLIFAIGAVSAADENITDTADVLSVGNADESIAESADDVLSAEPTDELEVTQTGTFTELNSLVKNTASGETLYLQKDYVNDGSFSGRIRISKAITIDGQGHTLNAKIMFEVNSDNVVLKNMKFINSKSSAIFKENYRIKNGYPVINCTFVNCSINSDYYGGGAIMHGNAYNCTFIDCYAKNAGGAILDGDASDCTFVDCEAFTAIHYISANNITYGSYPTVYVTKDGNAPGYVYVTINGVTKRINRNSDYVHFSDLTWLNSGSYNVKVMYTGSGKYKSQKTL